jgi:DNA (cytosine-5)-methyltransferase 1
MYRAISLFSSGGIADLALEADDIRVILANELLPERASLYARNFSRAKVLVGDIWDLKDQVISETERLLDCKTLDFILATPPCQGMSKNGQGKLLRLVREGKRPRVDPRNRLIIPTLEIVSTLRPRVVVFENVPEMQNTMIDDPSGKLINIIDYIREKLGSEYEGRAEEVEFADYGIPQRRKRLITVFTRDESLKSLFSMTKSFLPPRTHSQTGDLLHARWVTVRDTIGNLPPLDGKNAETAKSDTTYHYVPVLDPKKYLWISNTPPEKGAFDNQCINPICRYDKNPTHGSERNGDGINQAKTTTPLYCIKCGDLLPRPYHKEKNGNIRLMAGYTSAYKRMRWDLPAPTLTTNLSYPSSDHKIHPEQHRVLSLYEAFKLHTLDHFNYVWAHENGEKAKDTLITEIIGESIPPKAVGIIFEYLLKNLQTPPIKLPRLYRLKNSV